ncbi:MATE family efflux transporter [Novosphingobium humi]|uniref:MATE family efflux transporter n=1 Tax=Novosphingobium humi TaxID=2282397 RepID=UPI0025B2507B|nr:MATE family efflux transporter [Novosphingobium humi]WJT00009.1 MATE family efflux transporter [Novosphingobium humi]
MSEFVTEEAPPSDARPHGHATPMRGDLTQGPILKTLLLFSIPTLLSNLLQTLNGTVNSIWVGKLIGESALAATANVNIIMFLMMATVFGFGMATTVRVGQSFGARDMDSARVTFGSGMGFCVALSVLIGIIGSVLAPRLLHLMATPEASRIEALDYLRVVFITMPFGSISIMLSMGMRGVGDAKVPLFAMILTVLIDITMNPLLIRGFGPIPAMGIAGSAWSTAAANFAGAALMLGWIYARDLPLRLRGAEWAYLRPRGDELRFIIAKGLPMGAQMLLVSSAGLVMVGLVNREGVATAAAYGASMQLWNYLQMPAFAIASAVSAMVAQNVGAGLHKRVSKITMRGLIVNESVTVTLAVLIVIFDAPLLRMFLVPGSPSIPIAQHMQPIVSVSFVLFGIMMILTGTMRAYGAVILPLVIMFVAMYPARVGFYFVAFPYLGANALWYAYPFSAVVAVAMTSAIYLRGNWRKVTPKAGGRPA